MYQIRWPLTVIAKIVLRRLANSLSLWIQRVAAKSQSLLTCWNALVKLIDRLRFSIFASFFIQAWRTDVSVSHDPKLSNLLHSYPQAKVKVLFTRVRLCDWMYPTRLLCPWNSPGKHTGVGCHSLLQGIFLTQGSNPGLLCCRQILYHLSH